MSKKTLTRYDLISYAENIGSLKAGKFEKNLGVDIKRVGFYFVIDDVTGNVVFRFYVAPDQRLKQGARRTLLRIRNGETEPARLVALLDTATVYFVEHDRIKNLFGLSNVNGSLSDSAIQLRYADGENYTQWNHLLNDVYDFEFQLY